MTTRVRFLVLVGALGALLALAVLLSRQEDDPAARAGKIPQTARTLTPATDPTSTPMPGAHPAAHEHVPILMYHVIGHMKPATTLKLLWITPEAFQRHVSALKRAGYHAVTQRQVWLAWHHDRPLPSRPIVFSFDDGYAGHVRHALPILRRAGWSGVLNLTLAHLPDIGGKPAVRRLLDAGWEVESHTLTHLDLTTLSAADLRREVAGSRRRLQRLFGIPVSFFCYPAGKYNDTVIAALRAAGYKAATTVEPGWASPNALFTMPRIRVDGDMGARALLRRISDTRPSG